MEMERTGECYLCDNEGATYLSQTIDCPICGEYAVSLSKAPNLARVEDRHLVSGYIREQNELYRREGYYWNIPSLGDEPEKTCETIKNTAPRTVEEKANKLLQILVHKTKAFGDELWLTPHDYPLGYCKHYSEFGSLLEYLAESKLINHPEIHLGSIINRFKGHGPGAQPPKASFPVTAMGFEKVASLQKNMSETTAFVALWFADEMKEVYRDAIAPAVESAGYRPIVLFDHEYNGDVIDKMLTHIREARFIVSDFTGHRDGVYFEAGFAKGLGLEVIFTCRGNEMSDAHFDISHFNHIVWETPEQLRERLEKRITATIGPGPLKRSDNKQI